MERAEFRNILYEGAAKLEVKLDEAMLDSFELYKNLLLEWNERMNLTSITDENEIVIKHFLDSLSIIPHIQDKNSSLADIGTGAGFPGLAVKIAGGCGNLLLLDSLEKRIRFLENAVSALGLNSQESLSQSESKQNCENKYNPELLHTLEPLPLELGSARERSTPDLRSAHAPQAPGLLHAPAPRVPHAPELPSTRKPRLITLLHARAEDAGHEPQFREMFDCAAARAVSSLNVLLEYCLPFVRTGGIFIAMKGNNPKQEAEEAKRALTELGAEITDIHEFLLPFSDLKRSLIIIKKFRQTSTNYPRKAGKPSKNPL